MKQPNHITRPHIAPAVAVTVAVVAAAAAVAEHHHHHYHHLSHIQIPLTFRWIISFINPSSVRSDH